MSEWLERIKFFSDTILELISNIHKTETNKTKEEEDKNPIYLRVERKNNKTKSNRNK